MWMERLMARLDDLKGNKTDAPTRPILDGEPLLDNQDVCQMLKISKRTLQRYRAEMLPCHLVFHKTWYKESEVILFMQTHFDENRKRIWVKRKKKEG